MEKEGYVKFDCEWDKSKINSNKLRKIIKWRKRLYKMGLVGAYKNEVGFGNISIRDGKGFIITGSKTGNLKDIDKRHFSKVTKFNIDKNKLYCKGEVIASSESLTHGAVYLSDKKSNAVIHVHDLKLWKKLVDKIPTTNKKYEYGTLEIAKEVIRLMKRGLKNKVIVMGGHREGLLFFGKNIDEAGKVLLKYFKG